jgi:hypothetical protein
VKPALKKQELMSAIGAKAYQLYLMSNMTLPNANQTMLKHSFVIPFHDYDKHVQEVASDEYTYDLQTGSHLQSQIRAAKFSC